MTLTYTNTSHRHAHREIDSQERPVANAAGYLKMWRRRSAAERLNAKASCGRAERGVGLVEILVAVLVFSIGLLGVAMLQAKSLSTNNSAMARSMATMYSYSIIDAMRIDANRLASYTGTVKGGSCPTKSSTLAENQLAQWCSSLAASLGEADTTTGSISCDGNKVCTITIVFDDSRGGIGGSQNQTVITKVAL